MKAPEVSWARAVVLLAAAASLLRSEAAPVKLFEDITGGEWTLDSLTADGKKVDLPAGRKLTLKIERDGRISGQSAVNRYFGKLKLDGMGGCSWGRGFGSTKMAGPPERMEFEGKFFAVLPKTDKADLEAGVLTFASGDRKSVAVFGQARKPAGPIIEGQVVFKTNPDAALPAGARVKVSLQDVSLADAPSKKLGEVIITDARKFPVKFKIPYDKDKIRKGMRYTVSARIEDAKGLRFINDTAHPVFKDGKPPAGPVDLAVIKVK